MTQLEKAREEILTWHRNHNSHPTEWNYYRRELERLKFAVKLNKWGNILSA